MEKRARWVFTSMGQYFSITCVLLCAAEIQCENGGALILHGFFAANISHLVYYNNTYIKRNYKMKDQYFSRNCKVFFRCGKNTTPQKKPQTHTVCISIWFFREIVSF